MDLVIILVGIVLYFIPTILAKGKNDFEMIFWLNLFLGWTILGWLAAILWAIVVPKCTKEK